MCVCVCVCVCVCISRNATYMHNQSKNPTSHSGIRLSSQTISHPSERRGERDLVLLAAFQPCTCLHVASFPGLPMYVVFNIRDFSDILANSNNN